MTIENLNRETVGKLTLPDGKDTELYWDRTLKGFGLKVRRDADGLIRRSFIIQYRVGKDQRKLKLGDATKINADQARKKAEKLFAQITLGQDPQGERRQTASAITLRSAIDQYIQMKESEVAEGSYRANSLRITKLYLTGPYFAPLHRMGINEVTRAAVATRLNAIRQETSDTTAGGARAQLSAFYVRMMQDGIAEANPVIGTKPQAEKPQRDRVLNNDELAAVWKACSDDDFGRIIKLLVLTGCRRSEIGGLKWSEIDLDASTITLPPERTKNGRAHVVPLSSMAMSIIAAVPRRVDRDFLFGQRGNGFRLWTQCKDALKDGISEHWTIHDIRRSVATGMAEEIGVEPHIIEAILNHYSGHKSGVAGVYNRASYAKEKKRALAVWADHVASIVDGVERKIVPLRA